MKTFVCSTVELATLVGAWALGGWWCLGVVVCGWWCSNLIKRFWV